MPKAKRNKETVQLNIILEAHAAAQSIGSLTNGQREAFMRGYVADRLLFSMRLGDKFAESAYMLLWTRLMLGTPMQQIYEELQPEATKTKVRGQG